MGGVELDIPGALDALVHQAHAGGRRGGVLRARDQQYGMIQRAQPVEIGEPLDSPRTARVSHDRGGADHGPHVVEPGGAARPVAFAEPALDGRLDDRLHAAVRDRRHALIEGGAEIVATKRGGIGHDGRCDPVGMAERQPLRRHPADREAHDIALPNTQAIPEADDIADQIVERIGSLDGRRLAVSALVVAQDTEVSGERGLLLVPHAQVRGQRVGKGQPRPVLVSRNLVVDRHASNIGKHSLSPGR